MSPGKRANSSAESDPSAALPAAWAMAFQADIRSASGISVRGSHNVVQEHELQPAIRERPARLRSTRVGPLVAPRQSLSPCSTLAFASEARSTPSLLSQQSASTSPQPVVISSGSRLAGSGLSASNSRRRSRACCEAMSCAAMQPRRVGCAYSSVPKIAASTAPRPDSEVVDESQQSDRRQAFGCPAHRELAPRELAARDVCPTRPASPQPALITLAHTDANRFCRTTTFRTLSRKSDLSTLG